MASFGRLEEFFPERETIRNYLKHVELFFWPNAIVDKKKVSIFLSVAGGNIYGLLHSLLLLVKPQETFSG